MAKWRQVHYSIPKHTTASLRRLANWLTNHGHTILARPGLAPIDDAVGKRTTEVPQALRVASLDCKKQGSNPKRIEGYQGN